MDKTLRILMLEDNPCDAELVQMELKSAGFSFTEKVVMTEKDFLLALRDFFPDLILSEYNLPQYTGALALAEAKRLCPDVPFILVTGAVGDEKASEILTGGAADYVMKKDLNRLVPAVQRALAEAEAGQEGGKAGGNFRRDRGRPERGTGGKTERPQAEGTGCRKTEEALSRSRRIAERLAGEMAVIAEIGRLISSTLDIDEVYGRFVTETRKLIPFDRLNVYLNDPSRNAVHIAYVFGPDIPGRRPGDSFPLAGSTNEILVHRRAGLILGAGSVERIVRRHPHRFPSFRAGMRSFMSVPLISRNDVIGALHFRAKKPDAYDNQDLRLAERIGAQIAGAIANARLFSNLKESERSLRESEMRFRAIFEQAAVGVAEIDIGTGRYLAVNRRLCELLGRTEGEMLATTFQAITHPDDRHVHEEKIAQLDAGKIGNFTLEKRYLRKDGKVIWANLTISSLWKPGEASGRNLIIVEDISERKRLDSEMREMFLRDQLTELYNRRGFINLAEHQLKSAARTKRWLQLTFADVDGLKWINDNLGHPEGDRILIDAANILRRTFRESDIIARLGGDEFAILAVNTNGYDPEAFSARLQGSIDEYYAGKPGRCRLAMSWGTAVYDPESPVSLDGLMSAADGLMYLQKRTKANRR